MKSGPLVGMVHCLFGLQHEASAERELLELQNLNREVPTQCSSIRLSAPTNSKNSLNVSQSLNHQL